VFYLVKQRQEAIIELVIEVVIRKYTLATSETRQILCVAMTTTTTTTTTKRKMIIRRRPRRQYHCHQR
jgi:hypothetical protein